ncbi:helicase [Bacillus cereus]|jgi:hypothetical protein|uniref:protein Dhp61 n=1 Tax=Bacillus cereus group sp. BfR-BA-02570 TaxID=3094890 RepID=UPI0002797ECE|nr:hypothetical protein [Bacillus cereus group sp. BfR-BA-02570]AWC30956.1 hypothetical protein CG483_022335 [Bacillus cytotoxicus]EJP82730.1 hypothetical protein IAU_05723 [Bacillus cereus IS075]EOO82295.1 hypothetical protein IGS_05876 [Bacillus cereus IS845/00]EOO91870.1 hypothetical protein IGQ_05981 [Bacillus cereus IS195]KAB7630693.1 hypothetical protein GBN96_28105 [Bacillus sp. B4-WWTP-NA-D-NA-NA]KLA04580.1 hypothetical protein B4153_5862 [Bacillus cereus]SMD69821.1 hypothetical prot
MMSDYTSISRIDLVERFNFITIDLENKNFYIQVVDVKSNNVLLGITIDLENDTTKVAGNGSVKKYTDEEIEHLIIGLKITAQSCIDNNLYNAYELKKYLEN